LAPGVSGGFSLDCRPPFNVSLTIVKERLRDGHTPCLADQESFSHQAIGRM